MTINKAQGQSLRIAGLELMSPCVSHGQLYVGCSRIGSQQNLFTLAPDNKTTNVVYPSHVPLYFPSHVPLCFPSHVSLCFPSHIPLCFSLHVPLCFPSHIPLCFPSHVPIVLPITCPIVLPITRPIVLQQVPGDANLYKSVDSVPDTSEAVQYPIEFLNSLELPGVLSHLLRLKVCAPIMILRNLNPLKLCNFTRLVVKQLLPHVIEATILTGVGKGEDDFIPRIPIIRSNLPFQFKRLQFPIKLSYAMTINKAQGHSLRIAGRTNRTHQDHNLERSRSSRN